MRKSDEVRVDQVKKRAGVRVDHEKKCDGLEFTMGETAMG